MKDEILKDLLLKIYKEERREFDTHDLMHEYNLSFQNLLKVKKLRSFFIINNTLTNLRENLYVGKVDKKKSVSFLLKNDGDIKISDDKELFNNDIILYDRRKNKVLLYLERGIKQIIATVKYNKKGKMYFDLSNNLKHELVIEPLKTDFKPGEVIKVEVNKIVKDVIYATYLETIGFDSDVDIETLKLVSKYNWPQEFSIDSLNYANNLKINLDKELKYRKDFRKLYTFTIDGDDAKDLDDAISYEETKGKIKVGIHIADIGYFVKKDSPLDIEAYNRSQSLYLGNDVIPMLPPEISNNLGSLNPNEDKLCLSAIITFDKNYKQIDFNIYESIIRSKYRLTYDKCNNFIQNNKSLGDKKLDNTIKKLVKLTDYIQSQRDNKGEIDFKSTELYFKFDNYGNVIDVSKRIEGRSEKIIETLMILANTNVSNLLTNLDYPSLYRIHDKPDSDKLDNASNIIKNLGFTIDTKNLSNPINIKKILLETNNSNYYKIVNNLLLRSMAKAKYTSYQDIHFGLNLNNYTHFTAPIRRYCDLVVNRIIRELYFGHGDFEKAYKYYDDNLGEIANYISQKERLAIKIERDNYKLLSIEYLNKDFDKIYEGQIISTIPSGMFVEISNGIEGFVSLRNFDTYFYYDEENLLFFNDYNDTYKIGDFVKVKLIDYDYENLEIDFEIIKEE